MPLNFTRSYWKMHVAADVLEKVRAKARELDPSGAILDEDADCVRVVGSEEQIQAIEQAAGIGDPTYWAESAKPPAGTSLTFEKPPKE
ncbi:MAG: hypothetical protein ACYTGX_01590 [Planctomycetota bacterium]|jgi:hypothetical protein